MSTNLIMMITGGILLLVVIIGLFLWRRPKKLKADYFLSQWKELQGNLRDKNNWPVAILEADRLLDRALTRRKLKGKSMGEKMVSAQRTFSNNDSLWYAHNLAKKVQAGAETVKLKEKEVKAALLGYLQALKDIGALPNKESKDE